MQYAFILGHNPKLSVAEILAVLSSAKIVKETGPFLIIESEKIDCEKILDQLGGTIKIGTIISPKVDKELIVSQLKQLKATSKLNFGLSYYSCPKDDVGLAIKKELKAAGVSSRLVTSRDKALSSVVVTKNKCHEFLVLEGKWLARTCAVQAFEEYSERDYGRPVRDLLSGSMPPKLAKIMINLAQLPAAATVLDPFCGSGTVLQEALLLGYKVIGSDISDKAVKDTKKNLEWLLQIPNLAYRQAGSKFQVANSKFKIFQADAQELSKKIAQVDAIITEPYLGPPLRGSETEGEIRKIINELSKLYLKAFGEFRKILNRGGKIVIIFPAFRFGHDILELPILEHVKKLGFTQLNKDKLIYSRPEQKVWRQIYIFS